jgi:DNA-binding NtrC family response regulator
MTNPTQHVTRATFEVLIVEDDQDLGEILATVVSETGANVKVVGSVDAGLRAFRDNPEISMIFTDVMTPGWLNGFDLVHAVHEISPSLPVIVTSGYRHYDYADLPANAHFLPKPWSFNQVLSMVAHLRRT